MKKLLITFLAIIATTSLSAYSFKYGELYYNIISHSDRTVEVTSPQSSWPYSQSLNVTAVSLPSQVTYQGRTYTVTRIGKDAFCKCESITSIIIPSTVTSIGQAAFEFCYNLKSVTFPNSVRNIESYAFEYCSSLASIVIPYSVTKIDKEAFGFCTSLASITVDPRNTKYDSRDNCNAIIETATNTLIEGSNNTIIPNGITTIGTHAFHGREQLKSITIPETTTKIEGHAFGFCSALASIHIPYRVASISMWAFVSCSSLTSITVDTRNTKYDSRNNCNAIIETATNTLIEGSNNTIIPTTIIHIRKNAFWGRKKITSITIPQSVISIGDYAFYYCDLLASVNISSSVTNIEEKAFAECHKLKEINYSGSSTQWAYITKGEKWNGSSNPSIYYNKTISQEPIPQINHNPPLLALVENSLIFSDATGNNLIEADENSQIRFRVRNFGKGPAINCEARVQLSGSTSGITANTIKLPQINPNQEYEVNIPIRTNINTQDGKVTFYIEVHENRGFGIAPFNLTVATKAYAAPFMQVVDYHIASASGKVRKMEPFTLTFNLQNTKYGNAQDVKVNIKYPNNVLVMEGNENISFPIIKSGEVKTMQVTLIANNNAATTLPIIIDVKERHGKYSENKQLNIALNQSAATSVNIASTEIPQQNHEEITIATLGSDVDRNIPRTTTANPNTFVVILANSNYQHVAPVPYALNDGNIFRQYCESTLGIPTENIQLHADATYNEIRLAISWLNNICNAYKGDASVIFYYAGHGIPDAEDRSSYLLPTDGDGRYVSTAYKLDELYYALGTMPAKSVTVLLDACFSGANRDGKMLAQERGVALKAQPGKPQGNTVVLSAAQGDQTAQLNDKEKHGMFTYYLLKKLQESSGNVTLNELSQYIIREVERRSAVINKPQTPCVSAAPAVANQWQNWKLQ